jgi:hypothetical protein
MCSWCFFVRSDEDAQTIAQPVAAANAGRAPCSFSLVFCPALISALGHACERPMKPTEPTSRERVLFSLALAMALCAGCHKAGAQREAERLAQQLQNEPGCTANLRQWFGKIESTSRVENPVALAVPEALDSEWWRAATANATWSGDGKLQWIAVMHRPHEPFVIIGPPNRHARDSTLEAATRRATDILCASY